jgi:hypothetical protein
VVVSLNRLPRYLVLEPISSVRLELDLERPTAEIDVELENPRPGRSFLLLIGPRGSPPVQRMRLSGRARLLFEPKASGSHLLLLANPHKEPLVLRLRVRRLARKPGAHGSERGSRRGRRAPHVGGRKRAPTPLRPHSVAR